MGRRRKVGTQEILGGRWKNWWFIEWLNKYGEGCDRGRGNIRIMPNAIMPKAIIINILNTEKCRKRAKPS